MIEAFMMCIDTKSKKIAFAAAVLFISIIFSACSAKAPADPEAFKAATEELGLTVTEMDEAQLSQTTASVFIAAQSDSAAAQLVVFNDQSEAKSIYAQFLSQISEPDGKEKKRVDSPTYSKYFLEGDANYYALVRVDNSVFYAKGDKESGIVQSLVEKIGYN